MFFRCRLTISRTNVERTTGPRVISGTRYGSVPSLFLSLSQPLSLSLSLPLSNKVRGGARSCTRMSSRKPKCERGNGSRLKLESFKVKYVRSTFSKILKSRGDPGGFRYRQVDETTKTKEASRRSSATDRRHWIKNEREKTKKRKRVWLLVKRGREKRAQREGERKNGRRYDTARRVGRVWMKHVYR